MTLTALLSAIILTACGSSGSGPDNVSTKVRDREAYALGRTHATRILDLRTDEEAVQEQLLEVRARITNISSRLGAQSAHDYEAGFTDAIRENSDSLAAILF